MATKRNPRDWNRPITVVASYVALSFFLAITPWVNPEPVRFMKHLPLILALQVLSPNPLKAIFYWEWMIVAFPMAFLAFSLLAPIRLSEAKARGPYAVVSCFGAFFVLGLLATPYYCWMIFFSGLKSSAFLVKLVTEASQGRLAMAYVGAILMSMLLMTAWYSYVLIPIGTYRLLKWRKNAAK